MTYREYQAQGGKLSVQQWAAAGQPAPNAPTPGQPGGGASSQPTTPGVPATQSQIDQAANNALLFGANQAGQLGGNTATVQSSNQAGSFGTTGTENQQQTTQNQSTQNQTGTQVGTQTQTTTPNDTLGFGGLLQQAAQGAAGADATRTNFLTGLLQQGDPNLQNNVSAAVRNATSGPGMVGAGGAANDRAAAFAGQAVGQNSLAQQLQAAQQLAGPGAVAQTVQNAAPFIGSTSTGTNAQNTSNQSNSLESTFANLVNNQTQQGTSNAGSTAIGVGQTPQQATQSGGSIICTALVERGLMLKSDVADELELIRRNWDKFERAAVGYFFFGVPFAKLARRSEIVARILQPFALGCTREAQRRLRDRTSKPSFFSWTCYHTLFFVSDKLGALLRIVAPQKAMTYVRNDELVAMLKKEGLTL